MKGGGPLYKLYAPQFFVCSRHWPSSTNYIDGCFRFSRKLLTLTTKATHKLSVFVCTNSKVPSLYPDRKLRHPAANLGRAIACIAKTASVANLPSQNGLLWKDQNYHTIIQSMSDWIIIIFFYDSVVRTSRNSWCHWKPCEVEFSSTCWHLLVSKFSIHLRFLPHIPNEWS